MNRKEPPHEAPGDLPVTVSRDPRPAAKEPARSPSSRAPEAVKICFAIAVLAIIFGGSLRNCEGDSVSYSGSYGDRYSESAYDDEICWKAADCLKKARIYSRTGETAYAETAALKACDLGSSEGCFMLGQDIIKKALAENDEDQSKSARRSIRDRLWKGAAKVQESCIAGYPPACEAMARYTGGELSIMKNPARAGQYHTQACELEVASSCLPAIEFQWEQKKDYKKAWELSKRHCGSGNREACVYYAILAENIQSQEPALNDRRRWLRAGCDQYRIPGACYLFGFRTDRDEAPEERLKYLNEACALSKNDKYCSLPEKEKRIREGRNDARMIAPQG